MKKSIRFLSLFLAVVLLLAIPVSAAEISPYASNYFMGYGAYLEEATSSSFEVWFTVTAVGTLEKLGVNYIDIERSSDGVNWSVVKTYTKEDYSNLVTSNAFYHSGHITYSNRESGYQYRAYVNFYAKNSAGTATYGDYAYF